MALNREAHRTFGIEAPMLFEFAATSHLIAAVTEFAAACVSLAILFVSDQDRILPTALTGAEPGRNAFIRGDVPGANSLICFESQSEFTRVPNEGEATAPLFDANGADPQALSDRIKCTIDYADPVKRTEAFCKNLQNHKPPQPITTQTKTGEASSAVHDLMAVREEALNGLLDDTFPAPIYTHLVSLRAIERAPFQIH